ncbi:MAG: hypothetical protein WB611_33755 [Stellaceae bacterium]
MMRNPLGVRAEATPRVPRALHCSWQMLLSVITAGIVLLGAAGEVRTAELHTLHLRCTNPASGTSWPIVVDLDHGTVDSLAATINRSWISWHDPKQGFFDFDRATGKLQLRNASSTGGYFLYYTCRPE